MMASRPAPRGGDALADLRSLIRAELGIKMPPEKDVMLESRLARRLSSLGLPSLAAYRDHLLRSPDAGKELVELVNVVTTNKTDFFREVAHFEFAVRHALPELGIVPGAPGARVRAWCAGCSSGEEPYTLAMVLADHGRDDPRWDYRILGTDVSTRVLEVARAGIYEAERVAPVPPPLRRRYVMTSKSPSPALVRIAPSLRARVSFHRLNFMDAAYGVADVFDLIFFRNVAIYFDPPTQAAVVRKLCQSLRPGGYFFMGHAESLTGLDVPLRRIGPSIYRGT